MNRYPGVKPFDLSEQALFFGRDRDIADLCSLVRVEKLAVLFGKSGYGKSSLLNAGVLPRLSEMFLPIEVRLGEYIAGQSLAPLETLRRRLEERTTRRKDMGFLDDLQSGGKEDALWRQFKQAGGGGSEGFLLVLDQFEEFFSYPPDQQADFKTQLAALLHEEMPESLHEAARDLPREQRRLLAAPPQVRVLLAVRSDRLHELDRLKDALPAILHKRYELRALSREQAREAITGPALLMPEQGGESYAFDCPPFEYREDALQHILDDLTRNNTGRQGGVEAFQLQILCDSIESMVAGGRIPDRNGNGLPDVSAADLPPNFDAIYGAYYERRLEHLPEQHRAAARLLIEDGLVRYDPATDTKRRLSVDGDALLGSFARHGLTPELLRELEKTYLLRREPNTLGGYNYELSHDTLLEPVVAARKKREAEEAERQKQAADAAERERLRAEAEAREQQLAEEKRKRRRANLIAIAGVLLSLLAGSASVFAYLKEKEAASALQLARDNEEAAKKAQKETAEALNLAQENARKELLAAEEARKQTEIARDALKKADENLVLAKKEEARAINALKDLAREKEATDNQRQKAVDNLKIAEAKTKEAETERQKALDALREVEAKSIIVVRSLLKDARNDILQLDYSAAFDKLKSAADVGQMKDSVALALMEIAFFHTEADSLFRARRITAAVADLLGQKTNTEGYTQGQVRNTRRSLAPERYNFLRQRYYPNIPEMVTVRGGVFDMDEDYRVQVSDFRLAESETSFFQYALFCAATDRPLQRHRPPWGFDGRHVAVRISWYDACLYANWLTKQMGMPNDTVYIISGEKMVIGYDYSSKYDVYLREGARGFRLPTEAEWEWAAGGGDTANRTVWAGTSNEDSLHFFMNIQNNEGTFHSDDWEYTAPVKSFLPNRLGLYDMIGNAWEWCWDWDADYDKKSGITIQNPRGPDEGSSRVLRGGSWLNNSYSCSVWYRYGDYPYIRFDNGGFRLAQDK